MDMGSGWGNRDDVTPSSFWKDGAIYFFETG